MLWQLDCAPPGRARSCLHDGKVLGNFRRLYREVRHPGPDESVDRYAGQLAGNRSSERRGGGETPADERELRQLIDSFPACPVLDTEGFLLQANQMDDRL